MITVYYSSDYTAAGEAFDTTRKSGWVAASLQADPLDCRLQAPRRVEAAELRAVHTPAYVAAVRDGEPAALASSSGFRWDAGLWVATTASTGGILAAAQTACRTRQHSGSLSSGLHHARADHGSGFCTFNGLALAAHRLGAQGARVLILDVDAHGGGGTFSLIRSLPGVTHLDLAVSGFDRPEPLSGRHRALYVHSAAEYLPALRQLLAGVTPAAFDVCLYNAGMDPHEDDGVGGMRGITRDVLAERERIVLAWALAQQLPVAFALAGGYARSVLDQARVVALHRLTVAAAARYQLPAHQARVA